MRRTTIAGATISRVPPSAMPSPSRSTLWPALPASKGDSASVVMRSPAASTQPMASPTASTAVVTNAHRGRPCSTPARRQHNTNSTGRPRAATVMIALGRYNSTRTAMVSTMITRPAVKGRRAGAGTCGSSIAKDGRNTDSFGAAQKAPGRNHVGLLPRRGVR